MPVFMHPGWSARIELAGPALVDASAVFDALMVECQADTGHLDQCHITLHFSVDSLTIAGALIAAQERLPRLPSGWEPIGVDVTRYDVVDATRPEPVVPEVVGITEAADILGVSRQRAYAMARHADFPSPIVELVTGPIYLASVIRRFAHAPRHPGRPLDDPQFRRPLDPDLHHLYGVDRRLQRE